MMEAAVTVEEEGRGAVQAAARALAEEGEKAAAVVAAAAAAQEAVGAADWAAAAEEAADPAAEVVVVEGLGRFHIAWRATGRKQTHKETSASFRAGGVLSHVGYYIITPLNSARCYSLTHHLCYGVSHCRGAGLRAYQQSKPDKALVTVVLHPFR